MNQLQSPSTTTSNPGNSLVSQAQQWLSQGNVSQLLGKLPASLNRLSTTQKVLGGTLLVLGAGYLTRRGKNGRTHDQASTLHELLLFVNDRIEGYRHAVEESQDTQLRGYYQQLVSQSQQFANQLNAYLSQQGEQRETATTLKGKFYRGWMDAKAALTGHDEKAILGSNVYGEEWALKAYKDALSDRSLAGSLRRAVEHQYATAQRTYQELKRLQSNQ